MAIIQSWSPQRTLESAWEVLVNNWYLGFIAFGGPPVHFQIVSSSITDLLSDPKSLCTVVAVDLFDY